MKTIWQEICARLGEGQSQLGSTGNWATRWGWSWSLGPRSRQTLNQLRCLKSRVPAMSGGAEHLARGQGTAPGDRIKTCAWTRNYKYELYSAVSFLILITSGSIKVLCILQIEDKTLQPAERLDPLYPVVCDRTHKTSEVHFMIGHNSKDFCSLCEFVTATTQWLESAWSTESLSAKARTLSSWRKLFELQVRR